MNDETRFESLNLSQVQNDLLTLFKRVSREKRRLEIQDPEGDCVLISKVELESLERAIQILADTEEVKHLADELAHVAHVAVPQLAHA
jgi:PHD/YefM family antitoxin component YafN of YafNO toxin-antitoxin module